MAFVYCETCEGDGFTDHYIKNESEKTVQYFVRRCTCDSGSGSALFIREGEALIDRETFGKLESQGFRRIHQRREV